MALRPRRRIGWRIILTPGSISRTSSSSIPSARATAAAPEHAKEFYNVQGDIDSVAEVIRLYLTKYDRWPSPKFVAGESYGTTRAAGLSGHLHDRYGIDLNGVILLSTVLNFQTLEFQAGNDTPYPLWLPSYTAIAWYHKKLDADLEKDLPATVAQRRNGPRMNICRHCSKVRAWTMPASRASSSSLRGLHGITAGLCEKSALTRHAGAV